MGMGSDKPLTAAQKQMNQKNVAKFLDEFNHRSDVTPIVERSLKCDTLLVCGGKADAHVKGMEALFAVCDKTKTSMLKVSRAIIEPEVNQCHCHCSG